MLSAGHALAAFEDPDGDEPSTADGFDDDLDGQYTIAGDLPLSTLDFETPPAELAASSFARAEPLHASLRTFDESDVGAEPIPLDLPMRRASPARREPPPAADDGYDLETALEALDVDLDDLSIPHAKTERPGPTASSLRVPPRPRAARAGLPRATTEDRHPDRLRRPRRRLAAAC